MTGRRSPLLFCLFALISLMLLAPGCTPRRIEASPRGLSGSGLADFSIDVAPPLVLIATGRLTATVPTDDALMPPTATVSYALFAEGDSGPVTRHAHILFSELPMRTWRWEMETWAKHEALLYTTTRAGGKNWTIQMFPVIAAGDWFSALWQKNGRQTPDIWLAKRWSSTPQDEMRLLAEYREPAPACMRERLARTAGKDGIASLPKGKELWRGCEKEIEAFSARADAVFTLEKRQNAQPAPALATLVPPDAPLNTAGAIGRAEVIDRFRDNR